MGLIRSTTPYVVFTLREAESFWSAVPDGSAAQTWVHGVWSVSGLPHHIYVQKVYLERWIRPQYGIRFPFIRFRERVRALEPPSGRRRRLDGAFEADFLLSDRAERGSPLTPTIHFMDQVGRSHRVSCTFAWRGGEDMALTEDVRWSLGHPVTQADN